MIKKVLAALKIVASQYIYNGSDKVTRWNPRLLVEKTASLDNIDRHNESN